MKNRIILSLMVGLCVLQSCNNYLDLKPKGIQIPQYYDDYLRLLNHKDMMSADNAYVNYLTDDILLGESNLNYGRLDLAKEHQMNLYKFEHGPIYSSGSTDNLYEQAYKRIYTFNTVINNALNAPDGTEDDRQNLVAEAKVGRAYEYFILVNLYANHYDPKSAATDLGVPIMLSEDINKSYVRNSVQQVYDQIFKDLNEAEPFIRDNVSNRFRPTKQFLNAFLSRIYLYMGEYGKARTAATEALKTNVTINNLCLYSINPAANGMGRIYNAATKEVYPDLEDNDEAFYARFGGDILSLSLNVYANPDLLDLYKKDLPEGAVDQRRALYFCDDSYKLYTNVYKFPGKSIWVPYLNFNCGFSTPELYLIMAECHARLGDVPSAIEMLEKVRNNRILNNKPLPNDLSKEDVLRITLDERRREFAYGGSVRLIDLKRLNREEAFKKEIVHTTGDETWRLPANDTRYILPIPPKVLSANENFPVYER